MTKIVRRAMLRKAERSLEAAGIEHARRNAEWMLIDILGCTLASLIANPDVAMSTDQIRQFNEMVSRRLRHEPLQYILGYTEFYGLRVAVSPDVLIPRPETEQVVEKALELISKTPSARILDVGTGSGCIGLAIKSQRSDASVWACDISEPALDVARGNAASNELDVQFLQMNVLSSQFAQEAPSNLDLLVSNPPYVARDEIDSLPADVRNYEPHLALFAPEDPLAFYRTLADAGRRLLRSRGWLVLETHADYGREAEVLLRSAGYQDVELKRDYAGRSRILLGRTTNG